MNYKPKLPQQNDNISHDQPFREFILLCCGLMGIFSVIFWSVGLFIDQAVEYISPEVEGIIFAPFAPEISTASNDDQRVEILQAMIDELAPCMEISYPVKVYLVESDIPNAMAFPGGRILVLSGLLEKVTSRNGLTFILAHELAHFKNRDHIRALGRRVVFTALATLATGAGSDLTRLTTPTVNLNHANYSQDRESLADQRALDTLYCHYQHVGGAAEFFKAMMKSDKDSFFISHYFATHPEAEERIANLYQQAEKKGYQKLQVEPLPALLVTKSENNKQN